MRKIVCFLLFIFILSGCSSSYNLNSLQEKLDILGSTEIIDRADNNKPLYRYYASPDVGHLTSTQTANVFSYQGEEFIMNLDIATIINERFYNNSKSLSFRDKTLVEINGTYINSSNDEFKYDFNVYDFQEGKYLIYMEMNYVNFYSYCEYASIEALALEMMKIGKTVEVDKDEIIIAYSSKPSSEYVREQLDLFEITVPESGRIEELMQLDSNYTDDSMFEEDIEENEELLEELEDLESDLTEEELNSSESDSKQ